MPLIDCPDCGRQISDLAPACVHCGRPAGIAAPPPAPPAPAAPAAWPEPAPAALVCPLCRVRYAANRTRCPECQKILLPAASPLARHGFPRVPVRYAGFGPRLGAGLVDLLVLLPLVGLTIWLIGVSWGAAAASLVLSSVAFVAYNVGMHGAFGHTVGKRVVGIQVRQEDGRRITWGQAWMRSSVDIGFAVLSTAASLLALQLLPAVLWESMGLWELLKVLDEAEPGWTGTVELLSQLWVWSEVLVVLFNERKRALHDFIAGTVVVHV